MNFNLMFSEFDGIGFTVGYNYLDHQFNPNPLCLDQFYNFKDGDKQGVLAYILFGFNVYVDLAKRPDATE